MTDAREAITTYIELVGTHDLEPLADLFAHDLVAKTRGISFGKTEWIGALQHLLPVLVRNDIRSVFADGNSACVIYDFVTETAARAVVCVEWVIIDDDGRISEIELLFDQTNWGSVIAALAPTT